MIKLKPTDLKTWKYWVHLGIIVLLVYGMINLFIQPMPITLLNIFQGIAMIGAADIFAHTILGLE